MAQIEHDTRVGFGFGDNRGGRRGCGRLNEGEKIGVLEV